MNFILGPPYHRDFTGTAGFSIKAYGGGSVPFRIDGRLLPVNDSSYVMVNAGQEYAFSTPEKSALFNFTLFLEPTDVRKAWAVCTADENKFLDDEDFSGPPEFVSLPLPVTASMTNCRARLRSLWGSRQLDDRQTEELASLILLDATAAQISARGEIRRVAAIKKVTREEVALRIRRAIEYIRSDLKAPPNLDHLAAVACMGKFHFLRRFKQMTGATPYQFALQHRLSEAQKLLLKSDMTAAEIGNLCGFSSPATFTAAFRALTGFPPQAWRKQQIGNFPKAARNDGPTPLR